MTRVGYRFMNMQISSTVPSTFSCSYQWLVPAWSKGGGAWTPEGREKKMNSRDRKVDSCRSWLVVPGERLQQYLERWDKQHSKGCYRLGQATLKGVLDIWSAFVEREVTDISTLLNSCCYYSGCPVISNWVTDRDLWDPNCLFFAPHISLGCWISEGV